jgi:hypothetical protein
MQDPASVLPRIFLLRLSEKSKRASKRDPTSGSEEQKTRHRSLLSATDPRARDPLRPFFRQSQGEVCSTSLLGNLVSSVNLTPKTLKLSVHFGVSLCSLSQSMERPSPFATSSTMTRAMPETVKLRSAASVPFHFSDCHIANHSPPIVRKAPAQSTMLFRRPTTESL